MLLSSNERASPTVSSALLPSLLLLLLSIVITSPSVGALLSPSTKRLPPSRPISLAMDMARRADDRIIAATTTTTTAIDRREALEGIFVRDILVGVVGGGAVVASPRPADALVEGSKPPTAAVPRKALGEEYRQGTAALGDSMEMESLPREAYKKLPSGVIYADISVGGGGVVTEGSRVNVQWVLRRSNGYFVDSSAVSDSVPFIFEVGDPGGAIRGLDEGIRGMRAGGSRRILVPPSLAYVDGVDDGKPGPIPAGFGPRQQMRRVMKVRRDVPGEYIFLEVKVTKVR
ncbi:hypothetical protein ACHAW5_005424 [Stephanodiscus triporus]|uniref:peptidylprolyl isomerase n=1 Tax=Stephanodiscus triporus TaxID=2934178 RepID=A0ABD3NW34_9STRA